MPYPQIKIIFIIVSLFVLIFISQFSTLAITCPPGQASYIYTNLDTGVSGEGCAPQNQVTPQGTLNPNPPGGGGNPTLAGGNPLPAGGNPIYPGSGSNVSIPLENPLDTKNIIDVISNILNYFIYISVPILAFMILWGGFQILAARDDPEKVKNGRKTIQWAVLGFAIILISKGVALILLKILNG